MKKSRFSEDHMQAILHAAENAFAPTLPTRHEVSEQTIYTWSKRCRELVVAAARPLCELELHNPRLKKMVAERDPQESQ